MCQFFPHSLHLVSVLCVVALLVSVGHPYSCYFVTLPSIGFRKRTGLWTIAISFNLLVPSSSPQISRRK